jgi:hypothetical protein
MKCPQYNFYPSKNMSFRLVWCIESGTYDANVFRALQIGDDFSFYCQRKPAGNQAIGEYSSKQEPDENRHDHTVGRIPATLIQFL